MDAAAGAAGVKDDGVGLFKPGVGGDLAVGEAVAENRICSGGPTRYDEEDEEDEEEGNGDDEKEATEALDLIGEGVVLGGDALVHFVRVGGAGLEKLGGGGGSVADLAVGDGGGGDGLVLRRIQIG